MATAGAWRLAFRVSTLLALIAGVLLFAGATRTDDYFSWTIDPPQTAAFLGASYWAAAVLFGWASAQRSDWSRIRVAALPELTVGALLLLATLLHLDKFHDDLFGYFWICAYVLAVPVLGYLIVRSGGPRRQGGLEPAPESAGDRTRTPVGDDGERQHHDGEPQRQMPGWLRALLAAQAIAFAVYGLGLFVSPSGFDGAWPWPVTPLTARAIAAFLLGFAVAAAMAVWAKDLSRFRGAAYTYTVLGALQILGAILHSSDFDDGAALPIFIAFFASTLAAGLAGSLLDRGDQPAEPPPGGGNQPSSSRSAFSGS